MKKLSLAVIGFVLPLQAEDRHFPIVSPADIRVDDGLQITVWAESPHLFNPTNMDTDEKGRIWVTEGVNYRRAIHRPEGDRVVVLEDTDGDGRADSSHTFIQDQELISPLGISLFDNQIVVAQPPNILVYTDVDRDLRYNPSVDKREVLLSGFNGRNHDHSLHTTVAGPDGKWYINQGNCGAKVTDRDGRDFYFGGPYYKAGAGSPTWYSDPNQYAGKPSADGNIYHGGFAGRINPDGTGLQIVGYGFRNSYELCLSSLGDIFQNDNDDRVSCRVTWLMEGGNLGFFSNNGRRQWTTDRRPGQPAARAHWRQDDPGTIPAGDIYGAGSPTGIAFYENGALPSKYEGSLFSCEARARTIFGYRPHLAKEGAGMDLGPRRRFITCPEDLNFRPSDVMVGADGAIYVADWYDSRVGGHRAEDPSHSGAIYRIAPEGFKPVIPTTLPDPVSQAIMRLKSPAASVRLTGFKTLKQVGAEALPRVVALMKSENPWLSARAVWLLPHLGKEGRELCRQRLTSDSEDQRLLAFRALRAAGHEVEELIDLLVRDLSPAVRREVALSMRNLKSKKKAAWAISLFSTADGEDRHYLEACGMAAKGVEDWVWKSLTASLGVGPLDWPSSHVWRTWRLMPKAAVSDLSIRVRSEQLTLKERRFALDTLAFIGSREAVAVIVDVASVSDDLGRFATWWLMSKGLDEWNDFGVREALQARDIYNPDKIVVTPSFIPEAPPSKLPQVNKLLQLSGNVAAGKRQATRCTVCHEIDGFGVAYGPDLRDWIANQGKTAFFEAVVHPSKSIAHGYAGKRVTLDSGEIVEGLVYNQRDPVVVVSMGLEQMIPRDRIKSIRPMRNKSLMLSAEQLGLGPQALADLAAFLEEYRTESAFYSTD